MDKVPADTLRPLQIIAGGLIAGPIFFFGAAALVRAIGSNPADIPIVSYVAIGAALLSPFVAGAMRQRLTEGFAGERLPIEKLRASVLVSFGILDAAATLCAVAFLVTPTYWPLLAAVVPLGMMARWFPR